MPYKWKCFECPAESRKTWPTYGDAYDSTDPLRKAAYEHYHWTHGYSKQSGHRMCGPVEVQEQVNSETATEKETLAPNP